MTERRAGHRWTRIACRVLASLIIFTEVKAAHLVVENTRVGDVNGRRASCEWLIDCQYHHLFVFFRSDLGFWVAPPLVMLTSWKSMSAAFSVISEVA